MAVSCKLKRGKLSLKYNATLSSGVVSSQSSESHIMRYFITWKYLKKKWLLVQHSDTFVLMTKRSLHIDNGRCQYIITFKSDSAEVKIRPDFAKNTFQIIMLFKFPRQRVRHTVSG